MESKLTKEFLEKGRKAQSVEELKAVAKEYGVAFTEEAAQMAYETLHGIIGAADEELAEEELANVAGGDGGCGSSGPWTCSCGSTSKTLTGTYKRQDGSYEYRYRCDRCGAEYSGGWC